MDDFQFRLSMRMLDIVERTLISKPSVEAETGFTVVPAKREEPESPFVDAELDNQIGLVMDRVLNTED